MERLTKRDRGGNARMDCDKCEIRFRESCCSSKLCHNAVIDRLAEYEDAEEQGLIVRLPCKVGTPVFIIEKYADEKNIVPDMFDYYDLSAIGKTVFLTREEAGAALAKEG